MCAHQAEGRPARSRPSLRVVIALTLFGVALLATAVAALIARWLIADDVGAMLEGIGWRPPGTPGHGMMRNRLLQELFARTDFGVRLTSSIVYSGLAGAVVAGVVGYLGAGYIAQPLSALAGRIRRLAAGDYDRPPPGDGSSDGADRFRETPLLTGRGTAEVSEMLLAIDTLTRQLAAAESLRRRLVEDLAHELRSPLTAVRGYAEGLRDGVFPDPAQAVAGLQRELGRIERLITDLRHSALPSSPAEFWPVDLGELAASVTGGHMPEARAKGIDLQLHVGTGGPYVVLGDTDRLGQVLANLLDNALKYTPAGGTVKVTVGQPPGGSPDEVSLAVRDTGPGIPERDLPHIFQRLYRAERSRARSTGGSGIGLAIVKQIVLAHGGTVEAGNPEGGGALFVVRLRRSSRTVRG